MQVSSLCTSTPSAALCPRRLSCGDHVFRAPVVSGSQLLSFQLNFISRSPWRDGREEEEQDQGVSSLGSLFVRPCTGCPLTGGRGSSRGRVLSCSESCIRFLYASSGPWGGSSTRNLSLCNSLPQNQRLKHSIYYVSLCESVILVLMRWACRPKASLKAAVRLWAGAAGSPEASVWEEVQFPTHSCGCWLDSVPRVLLG